jgi:hypothetical protein
MIGSPRRYLLKAAGAGPASIPTSGLVPASGATDESPGWAGAAPALTSAEVPEPDRAASVEEPPGPLSFTPAIPTMRVLELFSSVIVIWICTARSPWLSLQRFRANWIPVRVKKTRQNNNLEFRF